MGDKEIVNMCVHSQKKDAKSISTQRKVTETYVQPGTKCLQCSHTEKCWHVGICSTLMSFWGWRGLCIVHTFIIREPMFSDVDFIDSELTAIFVAHMHCRCIDSQSFKKIQYAHRINTFHELCKSNGLCTLLR